MTSFKQCNLADLTTLAYREALLSSPHVMPLEAWRIGLLTADRQLPHMDPLDGGVRAKLLLLLETPGPGSVPIRFVSRDNATGTAANLRRFFAQAGIPREDTLLWNAVPWIIHAPGAKNRAPKPAEIRHGLTLLPPLLKQLPDLRVIVLAGRVAAQAEPLIQQVMPDMPILRMPHPSPTYVCTNPEIPKRIASILLLASSALRTSKTVD